MKATFISLALLLGISSAEEIAPWTLYYDPVRDALAGAIATGQPDPVVESEEEPEPQMALFSLPESSCPVDDPTSPEIVELAHGLEYSPWRIYEYCHNRIRHEAYWGCKKGAVLTLLEESGNSFDTSTLMVALLKAAGCTDIKYRYGPAVVSADEVDDWLGLLRPDSGDGVAYPHLSDTQFRSEFQIPAGTPITSALRFRMLRLSYLSGQGFPRVEWDDSFGPEVYYVPHVWVSFKDQGGASHELDPSFKFVARRMEELIRPGGAAYGYDLPTFRTASGPANPPAKSVLQLKEGQMADKLEEYSTALLGWLNTNHSGASTGEFLYEGLPWEIGGNLASNELVPGLDYFDRPWLATTSWSAIPDQWKTKVTFTFGTGSYDPVARTLSSQIGRKELFTACLGGEKLSYHVSGANSDALEFHWGEESLFGDPSIPVSGTTYDVAVAVTHPFGTYNGSGVFTPGDLGWRQQHEVKSHARTNANAYVYSYGFDASARHLRKSQDHLDAYRERSDLDDDDWQVRTEILNVMGLSYLQQKKLADNMVATHARVLPVGHHGFARIGQQNAYFIDFGLSLSGSFSYSGNKPLAETAFNTGTFFASALEHAMIEQLQTTPTATPVTAISTAKVFHFANQQLRTFYLADNSNWSTVRTTLESGGWPAAALDSIAAQITGAANAAAGAQVLLPARGDIGLQSPAATNEWRGYGYSLLRNNAAIMAISGGYAPGQYSGGYLSENGTVLSDPVAADYSTQPGYYSFSSFLNSGGQDPVTTPQYHAADPVAMSTGAFTLESTDLSCGLPMPRGLAFHRSYDSGRHRDREPGLGYGWTHNLNIYATRRSSTRAGLGDSGTPGQMTPMYVATAAAMDVFANRTATGKLARDWAIPVMAAKWGVGQLIRSGVSITMGSRAIEFVKVPDTPTGVFVPPAGITATLTETTGGQFTLAERHGNSYVFQTSGTKKKLKEIVDQHGKKATFSYNGFGRLTKVEDCYSRELNFTWNGNRITKVEETAGTLVRDVDYSYVNATTTTADDDTLTTVTDPENRVFTHLYTDKRITAIKDGRNRTITENFYDTLGRVKQQRLHGDTAKTFSLFFAGDRSIEQNPAGARTTYLYDRLGRATGVIDATGNRSSMVYDGQNQIVKQTTPRNNGGGANYRPVKNTYDANRNLTNTELPPRSATDSHGPYTAARVYDAQLRLWKEYDFKGKFSEYTYTAKHQVQTVRDRKGVIVQTNTYDADGQLTIAKDAANKETKYLNYQNGLPLKIQYPSVPLGTGTAIPEEDFTYNERGDVLTSKDRNGNITSYTYNKARQLLTTTLPAVDGVSHTTEIQYDNAGTAYRTKDPRGNWTETETSQTGKPLSATFPVTAAGIAVTTSSYDAQDRLYESEDPLDNKVTLAHDPAGRVTSTTDPLLRVSRSYYDADGQVIETRDPRDKSTHLYRNFHGEAYQTENAIAHTSSTVFDANGQQDTLTNKRGKTYDFTPDDNGRVTSLKTPLLKETTSGWTTRGLPLFVQEPSGDRADFVQDDMGRQRQVIYKQGTTTVATVTSHLDKQGNLKKIEETIGSVTKSVEFPDHDTRNRLRTYTDVRGKTIGYRHDGNGNLIELIYPDGKGSVFYTWDAMNRLTLVKDWANRETHYTYDLAGRLKKVVRENGTQRRLLWDNAGQLKAVTELANGGAPLWYAINHHDNAGRRDQEHIFPAAHAHTAPPFAAIYDDDNRLATFNGNAIIHDPDGNLTTGPLGGNPSAAFTYDTRNRLITAGGLTYGYDPAGNRVSVTSGTAETKWTIDPGSSLSRALVREKPDGTKTWYIYGLGLLYEVDQAGATTTYHPDTRGSTIALTAGDGQTVLSRYEYDAWGRETWTTGTHDTPFRYHGAYGVQTDPNGLCHMRARFYHPGIRRFLNADPLGFGGGSNWYQFAAGNPMAFADPLGLEPMSEYEQGLYFEQHPRTCIDCHWGPSMQRELGVFLEVGGPMYFAAPAAFGIAAMTGGAALELGAWALVNPIAATGWAETAAVGGFGLAGYDGYPNGASVADDVIVRGAGLLDDAVRVEQYALRAADSGFYPVMTRGSSTATGITWLERGDVWKFGTTKNPSTRYSQSYLDNIGDHGVLYRTEWQGTAAEALQLENMKIMNFQSQTGGVLPAGNKIVR